MGSTRLEDEINLKCFKISVSLYPFVQPAAQPLYQQRYPAYETALLTFCDENILTEFMATLQIKIRNGLRFVGQLITSVACSHKNNKLLKEITVKTPLVLIICHQQLRNS